MYPEKCTRRNHTKKSRRPCIISLDTNCLEGHYWRIEGNAQTKQL